MILPSKKHSLYQRVIFKFFTAPLWENDGRSILDFVTDLLAEESTSWYLLAAASLCSPTRSPSWRLPPADEYLHEDCGTSQCREDISTHMILGVQEYQGLTRVL